MQWVNCNEKMPSVDAVVRRIGYTITMDKDDFMMKLRREEIRAIDYQWLDETTCGDGWVQMEDAPKQSGWYLCWEVNYGKPHCDIYYYEFMTGNWTSDEADGKHPTHYQPLPPSPKKAKQ